MLYEAANSIFLLRIQSTMIKLVFNLSKSHIDTQVAHGLMRVAHLGGLGQDLGKYC